jgi:polyisoprenoid-binding protein YceI
MLPAAATLLALRLCLAADPAGPVDLAVRDGSSLSYKLVHKFHEVTGTSKAVEGKARLQPGGAVQVMVRARVDSFDSGNGNRDAHMQEATEAARFPFVTLKAVGAITPPTAYPATVEVTLSGQLDFHGVSKAVAVPVKVTFTAPGRATATGAFTISLDGHGVERPSLLFVKVDDAVVITASLALAAEGT